MTSYRSAEIVIWSSSKSRSQVRWLCTASASNGMISPRGTRTALDSPDCLSAVSCRPVPARNKSATGW